ncbi:hypothetical protein [Sphingobacterium sp. T2]|uniref:hypothetical protein n=1 Tax=Sphingobacterium sp. T2 TaxID=1590596 RepID=UPI00397E3A63
MNSTGSWHFINTPGNLTFEQFNQELLRSADNNLYKSYLRIKEEVKHNKDNVVERSAATSVLHHSPLFGCSSANACRTRRRFGR